MIVLLLCMIIQFYDLQIWVVLLEPKERVGEVFLSPTQSIEKGQLGSELSTLLKERVTSRYVLTLITELTSIYKC